MDHFGSRGGFELRSADSNLRPYGDLRMSRAGEGQPLVPVGRKARRPKADAASGGSPNSSRGSPKILKRFAKPFPRMVGVRGFEPPTLGSQSRCATRLRYTPSAPLLAPRAQPHHPRDRLGPTTEPASPASTANTTPRDGPFTSSTGAFSRTTPVSYAWADLALTVPWLVGVALWAPSWTVFLPGIIIGIAAILIDYVWMYRVGKRELLVDGQPPSRSFLNWWLIGWFEFLISFNMGVYLGAVLHAGLFTHEGFVLTVAFECWFWVLAPLGSRLLSDMGIGRQLVWTTRKVGEGLSWGRLGFSIVAHAIVLVTLLGGDLARSGELIAIGALTAAGMEFPLYILGIREGAEAWKTLLMNTLVEWNYASPIMYALLVAIGALS